MPTFNPALGIHERSRERVANISQGDLSINYGLGINIPVTELVLGQPFRRDMLGDMLFRKIAVPWNFQYQKFDLAMHQKKDAKRAFQSRYQSSGMTVDTVASKLARYGWETMLDKDIIGIANEADSLLGGVPLRIQERMQKLSKRIVDLSLEYDRSVIALAAGSYSSSPDLDTTLGAGSEFNDATNGDSRTAIRTMASAVAAANGALQITDIDVYLTHLAFEAAQDDPLFVSRRQYQNQAAATAADLQSYWGVGQVFVGDAHYTTDNATLTSMYGDVAILRVSKNLSQFDQEEGQLDSFVAFKWRGTAGAVQPYYDPKISSWCFPWDDYEKQAAVTTTAAGIIRNCKG